MFHSCLSPELNAACTALFTKLKRRQIKGSFQIGMFTHQLLKQIVLNHSFDTAQNLMDVVKDVGKKLQSAWPVEFVVGNIVRHLLYIIREESFNLKQTTGMQASTSVTSPSKQILERTYSGRLESGGPLGNPTTRLLQSQDRSISLANLLEAVANEIPEETSLPYNELRDAVIEHFDDFGSDIQTCYKVISDSALEHIHASEIIMTYGQSKSVEHFLLAAARVRKFAVMVVEGGPANPGHEMCVTLSNAGIDTTLITDSAVYGIMARVNKVIIAPHIVMANGGIMCRSGIRLVASAAKEHSIPVVAITAMYKLAPLYPHDQLIFNELLSPEEVLPFTIAEALPSVIVSNPLYDYVPPELLSLFVTNIGGQAPSYIYRMLAECYHPDDYEL
eukprot:GCRY01001832.1.p1 GENE.GCRY01001832.1~~GCRY01001832.1.p1  ORF type:complete len:390 (+),score=63.14 GCRY01001832.1:196-1365(+)